MSKVPSSPKKKKLVKKKQAPANDMKAMISSIINDMNRKEERPYERVESAPNAKISLNELREDINIVSSSLSSRLTHVEVKINSIIESIETVKSMVIERNQKYESDIQKCYANTNEVVEDERNKRLKLLKALQKKLTDDDVEIVDKLQKVKDETLKATTSITEQQTLQSNEISKLKATVDDL